MNKAQKSIPPRWKGSAIRLVRDMLEFEKVGGGGETQLEETLSRWLEG